MPLGACLARGTGIDSSRFNTAVFIIYVANLPDDLGHTVGADRNSGGTSVFQRFEKSSVSVKASRKAASSAAQQLYRTLTAAE